MEIVCLFNDGQPNNANKLWEVAKRLTTGTELPLSKMRLTHSSIAQVPININIILFVIFMWGGGGYDPISYWIWIDIFMLIYMLIKFH